MPATHACTPARPSMAVCIHWMFSTPYCGCKFEQRQRIVTDHAGVCTAFLSQRGPGLTIQKVSELDWEVEFGQRIHHDSEDDCFDQKAHHKLPRRASIICQTCIGGHSGDGAFPGQAHSTCKGICACTDCTSVHCQFALPHSHIDDQMMTAGSSCRVAELEGHSTFAKVH